jgi:type I restriction enzyme, S subunit
MASEWIELPFSDAVLVNPTVPLKRGRRYPFVDMGAVNPGARCAYATEDREFSGGGARFQHGDTLMARITPCLENGKIARFFAPGGSGVGHGSTEFIVIRGRPDVTDTDFAYYLTQWEDVRCYAIGQMTGTSGRQRVPTDSLDHLTVPIPPVAEQRAIVHILGTLDDKIELNRRMNETLEAMARALFKSWFVDLDPVRAKAEGRDIGLPKEVASLFPNSFDDSELGEIPKGWEVGTLADFSSLNPESWSKITYPEHVNYVDLSNTKWGRIEAVTVYAKGDAPSRAQRVLRIGDTIVGTVRPGNGSYALISENGLTGSTGFAVMRPHRVEYTEFIYLSATAKESIEMLSHLADGGAYPAVRPDVVAATLVLRPKGNVLQWFSQVVRPLLRKIAQNEYEFRTLAILRDTLLPKLISGELRVRDAEQLIEAGAQ